MLYENFLYVLLSGKFFLYLSSHGGARLCSVKTLSILLDSL